MNSTLVADLRLGESKLRYFKNRDNVRHEILLFTLNVVLFVN